MSLSARLALALVALGATTAAADPARELCGHGKPDALDLRDAAADPTAVIFVGRVADEHVAQAPADSFKDRVGTIDLDVKTIVQGAAVPPRIVVPAWAAGCIPKAGCPETVFDIATRGALVLVACVVPAHGAPRIAIVSAARGAADDMRRCLEIAGTAPHGREPATDAHVATIVAGYDGGDLAKSCAAHIACDDHHRAAAVRALSIMAISKQRSADAQLDLALGLAQPASNSSAAFGCVTPPKLFRADLHGADPTNQMIARTMLDGMLAATDQTHRMRWADLLWGLLVEWYEHPDEQAAVMRGLGKPFATRAAKLLRSLGGPDSPHYEAIATALTAAS